MIGLERHAAAALALSIALLATGATASAQDAVAGEKVFLKCRACHQIGEGARNLVGPQLNGLIGRKAGTVEGYSFSAANKASDLTWDEPTFKDYIREPKAKIPGTKMVFVGLKADADIDNLTAYLKQFAPDGKKAP